MYRKYFLSRPQPSRAHNLNHLLRRGLQYPAWQMYNVRMARERKHHPWHHHSLRVCNQDRYRLPAYHQADNLFQERLRKSLHRRHQHPRGEKE